MVLNYDYQTNRMITMLSHQLVFSVNFTSGWRIWHDLSSRNGFCVKQPPLGSHIPAVEDLAHTRIWMRSVFGAHIVLCLLVWMTDFTICDCKPTCIYYRLERYLLNVLWNGVSLHPFCKTNLLNANVFDVSKGLGGFRKLRKACRIHVYLSWYLSDFTIPSYRQQKLLSGSFAQGTVGFEYHYLS